MYFCYRSMLLLFLYLIMIIVIMISTLIINSIVTVTKIKYIHFCFPCFSFLCIFSWLFRIHSKKARALEEDKKEAHSIFSQKGFAHLQRLWRSWGRPRGEGEQWKLRRTLSCWTGIASFISGGDYAMKSSSTAAVVYPPASLNDPENCLTITPASNTTQALVYPFVF